MVAAITVFLPVFYGSVVILAWIEFGERLTVDHLVGIVLFAGLALILAAGAALHAIMVLLLVRIVPQLIPALLAFTLAPVVVVIAALPEPRGWMEMGHYLPIALATLCYGSLALRWSHEQRPIFRARSPEGECYLAGDQTGTPSASII